MPSTADWLYCEPKRHDNDRNAKSTTRIAVHIAICEPSPVAIARSMVAPMMIGTRASPI